MSNKMEIRKEYFWRIVFACLLIGITVWRIKGIMIPASSSEEAVYWDLILRIAGKEGILNLSQANYLISFGYAVPFAVCIKLGCSYLTVYKFAIGMNGLLWVLLYLKTADIITYIVNVEKIKREALASIVCLLPVFMVQASLLGPQMLLAVIALEIMDQVVKLMSKSQVTYKDTIFVLGICLMGCFVSPLFIAIVIGLFCFLLWEGKNLKENRRVWETALIILVVGILATECLQYLVLIIVQNDYNVWVDTGMYSLFAIIGEGRRTSGFLGLIFGAAGKAMYLVANTFGLIIVGLVAMFFDRKSLSLFEKMALTVFFHVFFLIVAIQRMDTTCGLPMDTVLSMAVAGILIKGITSIGENQMGKTGLVGCIVSIFFIAYLARDVWELKSEVNIDWSSSGIIAIARDFCQDAFSLPILIAAATAIVLLVLQISCVYRKIERTESQGFIRGYARLFNSVMAGIVCMFFVLSGERWLNNILNYAQKNIRFSYEIPGDYLERTNRHIVYYYTANEGNRLALTRLFSMENVEIEYTRSLTVATTLDKEDILITNAVEEPQELITEIYERVYSTNQIVVWEHKEYSKQDALRQSLIGEKIEYVKVNSSDYSVVEFGKDFVLPVGTYEVVVEYDITTSRKGLLGRAIARSESKSLASKKIKGIGSEKSQNLKFQINSVEDMNNFRIVIYKERASDLDVNRVWVTRIGDAYEE